MLSVLQIRNRAWQLGKATLWFCCSNNKNETASKLHICRAGSTTNQNVYFSHITKFELMFMIKFMSHILQRGPHRNLCAVRSWGRLCTEAEDHKQWEVHASSRITVPVPLLCYLTWQTCSENDTIPLLLQRLSSESFLSHFPNQYISFLS